MSVDTAQIKAFLRIAETGSISRAAKSLGIAQPSLSQQLLRLEDEVGIRLFERTARGVTLTEAGRVFQERARQVMHAVDQAVADARDLRDDARGQVIFAMPPSIAQVIGARLIQQMAVTAPLVQVRISEAYSGAILGWVEAGKIDIGILYGTWPLRHLLKTGLASDELVVIGPDGRFGHPAQPPEVAIADLAGERWIAPGRQHGLRQVIDAEASRLSVNLDIVREVDSIPATVALVSQGFGLAILPRCAIDGIRWEGALSVARLGNGGWWRRLSLVRNPGHVLTHASVRVSNEVRAIMARLVAEGTWPARLHNH